MLPSAHHRILCIQSHDYSQVWVTTETNNCGLEQRWRHLLLLLVRLWPFVTSDDYERTLWLPWQPWLVCALCVSVCENFAIRSTGCAICSSLIKLMHVCVCVCAHAWMQYFHLRSFWTSWHTPRLLNASKMLTDTHTHTGQHKYCWGCLSGVLWANFHHTDKQIRKLDTLPSGCCSSKSSVHLCWRKYSNHMNEADAEIGAIPGQRG